MTGARAPAPKGEHPGANCEIRTHYLGLTKTALIRMSLEGAEPTLGFEPRTFTLQKCCATVALGRRSQATESNCVLGFTKSPCYQ